MRQIAAHFQEASRTVLEERVHHLELAVARLTETVRELARRLDDQSLAGPGEPAAADAATEAAELLLAAGVVHSEPDPHLDVAERETAAAADR